MYSSAKLNRVGHATNIEKKSIILCKSFKVIYDKSKYIKQDMYSVTYNPSFLSFFPMKERTETDIKFPNTQHHPNIIQNLKTTLNLVTLTDLGNFLPDPVNMQNRKPDHLILTNSMCPCTKAIKFRIIIKHVSYLAVCR